MVRNYLKKLLNNPKKCKFPQCVDVNSSSSQKNMEQTRTPMLMETNMIKFCSMLICNDFVDIVAFSYISISFYCISIYVCIHYHMSMPHVFTIQQFSRSSFSFLSKNIPDFSAGYLSLFVSINLPLPHLPSSPWLWCSSHKPHWCVGHRRKEWPTNLRCRPWMALECKIRAWG